MKLEKLESVVSRLFFFGAFLLLVLALVERIANQLGASVLPMVKAVTMLETAVVLLVFVIAIQLRAIRETFKHQP